MSSSLRSLPPRSVLARVQEDPDSNLFEAPSELVCPITHAVFLDPVLTQAGHAYERQSIEQHLATTNTDPMSRQPLLNSSLTPVFVLKSRALEYRESTARLCIDRACSVSPARAPTEYLRRAVDLCYNDGCLPKGLTSEVVEYVNTHLSNVYDNLILEKFAQSLFNNGYRDKAAAVYFHLLVSEEDRAAQANMLKQCLSCWQEAGSTTTSAISRGGGDTLDTHVFEKLVQMIETKGSQFGWIIEVSSEAGLGNTFVARLCEYILFPQRVAVPQQDPSLDSSLRGSGPRTSSSNKIKLKGNLPWETEKEVLLKYCFVLTAGVKEEHAELNNKIHRLEEKLLLGGNGRAKGGRRGGRNFSKLWMNNASSGDLNNSMNAGNGEGSELDRDDGLGSPLSNALMVVNRVARHPFVMLTCGAVAILGDPHHPLVRSTFIVPFLALMHRSSGGDGGRFSSSEMPHSLSVAEVGVRGQTISKTNSTFSSSVEEIPASNNNKESE